MRNSEAVTSVINQQCGSWKNWNCWWSKVEIVRTSCTVCSSALYLCTHNWTLGALEYPESPVKLTEKSRRWQKEREFIILSSFIFNCVIVLLFKRFCWQDKTVRWDSTRFCVSTLVPKITEDILKKKVFWWTLQSVLYAVTASRSPKKWQTWMKLKQDT